MPGRRIKPAGKQDSPRRKRIKRRLKPGWERIDRRLQKRFDSLGQKISEVAERAESARKEREDDGDRLKKIFEHLNTPVKHLEKLENRLKRHPAKPETVLSLKSRVQTIMEEKPVRKYIRKFRMIGTAEEVDEFGYDPVFWDLIEPVFNFFYE